MEIKEVIAVLENYKLQSGHSRNTEALQTAVYHLETLQKVKEMGGVKRKDIKKEDWAQSVTFGDLLYAENAILDLKDAELARRLERLEEVINKVLQDDVLLSGARKWVLHGSYDMFCEEVTNKIQELILGKKEE